MRMGKDRNRASLRFAALYTQKMELQSIMFFGFEASVQNGFTTTIRTIPIIARVGISFASR